jgi:hypothetical protein
VLKKLRLNINQNNNFTNHLFGMLVSNYFSLLSSSFFSSKIYRFFIAPFIPPKINDRPIMIIKEWQSGRGGDFSFLSLSVFN